MGTSSGLTAEEILAKNEREFPAKDQSNVKDEDKDEFNEKDKGIIPRGGRCPGLVGENCLITGGYL